MRARILTVLMLGMLAPTAFAVPASADDRKGGAYIDDDGDPTATAIDHGGKRGSGGNGGGESPCEWRVVVEDDFRFAIYSADTLEKRHSATGRWLEYWCDGYGATEVDGAYLIPEGGLVDPRALAERALASVQISPPAIRTSPSEDGRLYVQVPTWLWIDPTWWRSYEATARTGRVWSTVSARPVSVTWGPGDGSTISCAGSGAAWTPEKDEQASDCTHVYRRSSAGAKGGTFPLKATVRLEVTWTSNAAIGGSIPAISRSSSLEVEVGEIQAIGTRGEP